MNSDPGYSLERIGSILSDIGVYIRDLEELDIRTIQDLDDKRNFYAASMILFTILNRVFDLGNEVCIAQDEGIPSSYREIFILLQKKKIISEPLAREMIGLVSYRNLLSHEYHGIDAKQLFALTTKLPVIHEFVRVMQKTVAGSAP